MILVNMSPWPYVLPNSLGSHFTVCSDTSIRAKLLEEEDLEALSSQRLDITV